MLMNGLLPASCCDLRVVKFILLCFDMSVFDVNSFAVCMNFRISDTKR